MLLRSNPTSHLLLPHPKANCCKRYVSCRKCHDESPLPSCPPEMSRQAVQHIQCLACGWNQLPMEDCLKCGQRFARYFCPKCRFYDDDLSKKAFHCDGCGLCRVGGRENFKHCDRCCVCYANEKYPSHKCVEAAMGIL